MPKTTITPAWAKQPATIPTSASTSKQEVKAPTVGKVKQASGGSWSGLGVSTTLSRALALRGFKIPTPIQRATLPSTLASPPRDVLGMARTGSGKTLAYIIPLLQRLATSTSTAIGPKALILCPTRELALQILKVGKDLGRGKGKEAASSSFKWALIMGGDSLDAQFEMLAGQPDVIIATPGRLLHLVVEMNYDMRSIEMVIYDEADRLFEMGFEVQLHEILHRLPSHRQNLLFSATLPSAVAEFAKAGLTNPLLHRLDSEQKISDDLQLCFFEVKRDMKDAALLAILDGVLRIAPNQETETTTKQAIVFVSTKHHVEYLTTLLSAAGFRTNHIYGSLDQVARQQQLAGFRAGQADLLIVTDVAARGIDIPIMDNVINYDFPTGVKSFIHRVGRTARAGRKGTAWSFITRDDMPYAVDLEGFLRMEFMDPALKQYWSLPQTIIDKNLEQVGILDEVAPDLPTLRSVMERGRSMFERSRTKASSRSHKQAKERRATAAPPHPAFVSDSQEHQREAQSRLLATLDSFTPSETILEVGQRGRSGNAGLMAARRTLVADRAAKRSSALSEAPKQAVEEPVERAPQVGYRDNDHYIDHARAGAEEETGYSISNPNFTDQVGKATFDMNGDEGSVLRANRPSQLKWDRKKKKMVSTGQVGADNKKMIRSESGALLPASYKSGRFEEWRKKRKHADVDGPSQDNAKDDVRSAGKHHRHTSQKKKAGASEIKTTSQIMRQRQVQAKRQAKNSRPSRKR